MNSEQSALLAAPGRVGAKVYADPYTLSKLEKQGFVTRHDNLTAAGVQERSRVQAKALDEAFG